MTTQMRNTVWYVIMRIEENSVNQDLFIPVFDSFFFGWIHILVYHLPSIWADLNSLECWISIVLREISYPIGLMVHLRFLSLSSRQSWILSQLPKLQKLEIILLVGMAWRFTILSIDNIWDLFSLRHCHFGYYVFEIPRLYVSWRASNLLICFPSLPMSPLGYRNWKYDEKTTESPKAIVYSPWIMALQEQVQCLPKTWFSKYYTLQVSLVFMHIFPKIDFVRLEISTIMKLEHIEVLKLRIRAFEGKIWYMRDGEFPKLKVLSLCKLDIEQWNAEEVVDHPPRLSI